MRSETAPAFGVRWLAAFFLAPRPLNRQKEGGKPQAYDGFWGFNACKRKGFMVEGSRRFAKRSHLRMFFDNFP
ncbi:MAG: hypothetical protein NTX50_32660, partial [Candidatus Sumerlaeota bacterium]|nr:hypothetical protein [Candidatus Sumerlaeota bacterium]